MRKAAAKPSPETKATMSSGPAAKFKRGEIQDQVLERLRHGLMVGAFLPGQVMSLRKLAAHLGTSPMPVREALSHLVAANVLEALPSRSVRVPRLTESRLKDLTEVRVAIEGMAARAAAPKATPELIAELDAINSRLLRAIAKRDLVGCLASNQAFHFTLYRAAESEVLMPLIEALWLQCGPTMYLSLLAPDMPWDASAHAEVLDALRRADTAAAHRALIRDIRTTAKHLLKIKAAGRADGAMISPMEFRFDPPAAKGAAAAADGI